MTSDAIAQTVADDPMDFADFTVVATNPAQMERSQKSLILWVARKIQSEKELEADTREQHDIALRGKWKILPWKRRLEACVERLHFYRKIKSALEAGYYIVPPFPMDAFAVRTDRATPHLRHSENKDIIEPPRALPEGEGRYVSARPALREHLSYAVDPVTKLTDYNKVDHKWYSASSFTKVDFPFKMVKPIVMQETEKAMAMKVFDKLGVLPAVPQAQTVARGDPMICGQIVSPRKSQAPVTFFIAWWLDTRSI